MQIALRKKKKHKSLLVDSDHIFDENKLKEDNEEMQIVRGSAFQDSHNKEKIDTKESKKHHISEISLCDYYLIKGNPSTFKVYPFIKKKGERTGAIGNCIYEYNENQHPIIFSEKVDENIIQVENDTKLYTIIEFCALLLKISVIEILNLKNLCLISNSELKNKASLFEVLKMISKI